MVRFATEGNSLKLFPAISLTLLAVLAALPGASAREADYGRLPAKTLDVTAPSERVRGKVGEMSARQMDCRSMPLAETRRRIVDIAVQEWGFFGFPIVDYTRVHDELSLERARVRFPGLPEDEAMRLAPTVAGYWAATAQGANMITRQNRAWEGPFGIDGRWADPWSAAFISWVMCEAGLGETGQFQRGIAHWSYIDQAIRARDGSAPNAGFAAYDVGDETIAPGDMLCSSRRPTYRSVADRRRQMGNGARTHCDIVVKVDEPNKRIFAIGGNVRRAVSLKLFPAVYQGKTLRPVNPSFDDERPMFVHMKLRSREIEANALDNSPTMKALDCELIFEERHPAYGLTPARVLRNAC